MPAAVMRLAVICILLLKMSFGLRIPFVLDHIFRALTNRNIPLFPFGNSRQSISINSEKNSKIEFLKNNVPSNNFTPSNGSITDDSLKADNGTESEISHGNVSESSMGNITTNTYEVTNSSASNSFSDVVAENGSSTLTTLAMEDSMETTEGTIGITSPSSTPIESTFSTTSAPDINVTVAMKDATQNTGLGNNSSFVGNHQGTIFTELTNGDKCIYVSAAKSFPKVTSVATFVNTFMDAINSSELLTKLFNITNARPEQYSQFKYRFIADVFRNRFVDANEIAAAAVRPIAKYFNVLPLKAMMSVYSNFFADFFFAEGILTASNAKTLAQKYIKSMEEIAKLYKIKLFDRDYSRKFQAIGDGTRNFFFSLIEPSLSETWELALYYAHEWLLAALEYGNLKDQTFKKEDICEKNEF